MDENEIKQFYIDKVKLNPLYFLKYNPLPKCPVKIWNYNWKSHDFPRVWCILDFIEWIKKYNIIIEHLGYTGDNDPELEFIIPVKKTLLSYPPYDLHTISNHFKNEFDFFYLIKQLNIYIIHLNA
jgi:hypothetical protein